MRRALPLAMTLLASLAAGAPRPGAEAAKVAPGPNEPDWSVVLDKMLRALDVRRPGQPGQGLGPGRRPACSARPGRAR